MQVILLHPFSSSLFINVCYQVQINNLSFRDHKSFFLSPPRFASCVSLARPPSPPPPQIPPPLLRQAFFSPRGVFAEIKPNIPVSRFDRCGVPRFPFPLSRVRRDGRKSGTCALQVTALCARRFTVAGERTTVLGHGILIPIRLGEKKRRRRL